VEIAKSLIIGSSSFLGKNLCALLQNHNEPYDTINRGEVKDEPNSFLFSEYRYNKVFLLAAHVPYEAMHERTTELWHANVDLPKKVIKHFKQSKIIFSSSVSVYGKGSVNPIKESDEKINLTAYGESKLEAEKLLGNHICLRFSSIYGPGMSEKTVLPILVKNAVEKKQITLIGDINRYQDFLNVKDAAQYLYEASKSTEAGIYNACYGKSYSLKQIAEILSNEIPGLNIIQEEGPTVSSYEFSTDKWLNISNFRPQIDLQSGIKELIRYYSKN
jgi:UDP-glucose 4-epimerase